MSILVDKNTKVICQGLTGKQGTFHTQQCLDYGTKVVAGVTPGRGGETHLNLPVFDTVAEAVRETSANTSLIFVPARFAADAVYEAVDAGIHTVICITEHIPAHEMLRIHTYARAKGVTMIGWPSSARTRSVSSITAGKRWPSFSSSSWRFVVVITPPAIWWRRKLASKLCGVPGGRLSAFASRHQ